MNIRDLKLKSIDEIYIEALHNDKDWQPEYADIIRTLGKRIQRYTDDDCKAFWSKYILPNIK